MAVKKGILEDFLKPSSHYSDNQKNFRSIFIDKNEDNLQLNTQNFFEPSSIKHSLIKKQGINRVQTGYKSSTKMGTNQVQIEDKLNTQKNKLDTNWVQTEYVSGDAFGDKLGTNQVQTEDKPNTKTVFTELYGIQREIIICLCQLCKKNRSKITEPLTIEYLTLSLNRTYNSIKTSIKRLEKKGCIIRVNFKNGRGGWSKYEILEHIYHEAIQYETGYKLGTNRGQIGDKLGAQVGTETGTTIPSSSSSLKLKETTTVLDDEWNFDITAYARLGFAQTQIKQLASLGIIPATQVEQSLIEFNYDLENDKLPLIKTSKLNFLMGLLRGGNCYTSENYRSEQEKTIKLMAERVEKKKQAVLEEKFIIWEDSLTQAEKQAILKKILPRHLQIEYQSHGLTSQIKRVLWGYYIQSVKEKEDVFQN